MSRCFPFPPPGYENKARTEAVELLTKEKHIEKKHKKEKRDKGKRDRKEAKDKGRSQDEHREKKDRKEKHRDKGKDKDRDKSRTSEARRAEDQTVCPNNLHGGESRQKAEESKDSMQTVELGGRFKDDEAGRFVGSFTNSSQRNFEGMDSASAPIEKKTFANNKVFPAQAGAAHSRNNGMGRPKEDATSFLQRKTGSISPAAVIEKERDKMPEKITVSSCSEKNRNHGISQPMDSIPAMVQRKFEGSSIAARKKEELSGKILVSNSISPKMERENHDAKIVPSNSINAAQRRNDIFGRPLENLPIHIKTEGMCASSSFSRIEDMAAAPAREKERVKSNDVFPYPVGSQKRRNITIIQLVENEQHQKIDTKGEIEVKIPEDGKGHKDRDHIEKTKEKDRDRHSKEKKKEEEIVDNTKSNKIRNFGKNNQADTLNIKPLIPHKDNRTVTGVNGTSKKRKEIETNGFLHENDARAGKILRMTATSQPLENGRTLELSLCAPSGLSLKDGSLNNMKLEIIIDSRENKINGTAKAHRSLVNGKLLAEGGPSENCKTFKSPHPDCKYLRQIYIVPQMEEYPKSDDQEWLFSNNNPLREPKADETPQVWAETVWIESTDIFALPYVIPF